jgi:uncharacterized protein (TIGR03435 family)
MMLLAAGILSGQAFEAVSIRPSPPHYGPVGAPTLISGGPGTADPERLTVSHFNVQSLIVRAYSVRNFQISGLDKIPKSGVFEMPWIEVDPFDIVAKVPPGATKEQIPLMLQKMLVERFALRVHLEKKEAPIYKLVVAKAGVLSKRLVVSSTIPTDTEPPKPFALPPGGGPLYTKDQNGFPIIPKGSIITRAGGNHVREVWHNETMEKLAAELSDFRAIQRGVRDATGLKDEYDFTMYWTQETMTATNGIRDPPPAEPLGGPSIFEALEKQLGLRLEPSKGPVDFLVIDHIDRTPTEN